MAQERKIVPNLYTSGGEFVLRSKQSHGTSEEYVGSFHYDIDEDKYFTYSTPEVGIEPSQEIVLLNPESRDENGYLIAPYNSKRNYQLKLFRKKYEDVKEVIDTRITELAPPELISPELTIEERIKLLMAEFADLKEHMSDETLDLLIRESLLESSQILVRGNTDELVLSYFDIAHFGVEMKGTVVDAGDGSGSIGPLVKIEINGTDVFDGEVSNTDYSWYNFMIPVEQDVDSQQIDITYTNDAYVAGEYDRNLYVSRIKNKPITYHAYADNPDIAPGDTYDYSIDIPEITSSIRDESGEFVMIPATPYSSDIPYDGYQEHIFEFRGADGEDVPDTTIKDWWNNTVNDTSALLYDQDGYTLISRTWAGSEDANAYLGKFKQSMLGNSKLRVDIPNDWFLSEYPAQPVEFTTDDFQIGTIKANKIHLIEAETRKDLQEESIENLKNKLNEENEELIMLAEAANSISESQAVEILSLKGSVEMMSETYLQLYDGEDTGHNMAYNSRFRSSADGHMDSWVSNSRPKFWFIPNSYVDGQEGGGPRMVGEWMNTGGAPSDVSGYKTSAGGRGKIRLHYFPPGGTMSEEGWPNETQKIGFRMKANDYRGWPRVSLKDMKTGRKQTKTVNSRDWKIYYFDLGLADVGVENRNIKLLLTFINNKQKKGPWYRRGKYNNKTGRDRDVWISHIVREDGTMYATNKSDNPTMTDTVMRYSNGDPIEVLHNEEDYRAHTAQICDVKGNTPRFWGWNRRYNQQQTLTPPQKFNNNGGIRFEFPANSLQMFVKGEAGSPPPNRYAAAYCGGRGFAENDTNGHDGMDDMHGIFILPHRRYKFKFCAKKSANSTAVTVDNYESASPTNNRTFGAFVADRRNGWRGSDNPYPGEEGYEWFESDEFELPTGQQWGAYEIEFEALPGPQGGTKVYFGFYMHKGIQGEKNIVEFSECRIVGPLPDDEY